MSPLLVGTVSIPMTRTLVGPAATLRVRVCPTLARAARARAGPSTAGVRAVRASAAVNQWPALSR